MKSTEFSAYIKGILEGANLDLTTPEGKVISALTELCGQLASELSELSAKVDTCNDYIEEIDEDLGAVEEIVYDLDDDCDCDDDDDDDECGCCCGDDDCGCDCDDCDDCDDDEDDTDFYCALCPHCGGKIYFDDSVNPEDIVCPACQKPLVEDEPEDNE